MPEEYDFYVEGKASLAWAANGEFSAAVKPPQARALLAKLREAETKQPLQLDEYEMVNLVEALVTLRALGLDTGDWLGQITYKLPPQFKMKPNVSSGDQIIRARAIVRARDLATGADAAEQDAGL